MSDEAMAAALERARAGDREAFGELFREAQPEVGRLCRRMLDDAAAAEDATSEVFLRARRGLESYDPAQPFKRWLLAIASNHCIDRIRRRSTERRLFSPADLSEEHLADPAPDPLGRLSRREQRGEILDAIDALPMKYRLPLMLRFYSDFEYDAIAGVLGVTRNQVGTLLFRAKRRLREQLEQQGEGRANVSDPEEGQP